MLVARYVLPPKKKLLI